MEEEEKIQTAATADAGSRNPRAAKPPAEEYRRRFAIMGLPCLRNSGYCAGGTLDLKSARSGVESLPSR